MAYLVRHGRHKVCHLEQARPDPGVATLLPGGGKKHVARTGTDQPACSMQMLPYCVMDGQSSWAIVIGRFVTL
jgi:hypothetical protein